MAYFTDWHFLNVGKRLGFERDNVDQLKAEPSVRGGEEGTHTASRYSSIALVVAVVPRWCCSGRGDGQGEGI